MYSNKKQIQFIVAIVCRASLTPEELDGVRSTRVCRVPPLWDDVPSESESGSD